MPSVATKKQSKGTAAARRAAKHRETPGAGNPADTMKDHPGPNRARPHLEPKAKRKLLMSAHPIAKNARTGEQVAMSTPAPAQQGTGRVDDVSAGDQVVANEPVRRDPRAKIAAALVQSALLERHVHWTSPPMGDEHIDQQQWEELCAAYRATWQHREVRDDIAWTQAPEGLGFDPHARIANGKEDDV